jgi:hypothetical protein
MDRFSSDNFITGFFFANKEDGTVRPSLTKGKRTARTQGFTAHPESKPEPGEIPGWRQGNCKKIIILIYFLTDNRKTIEIRKVRGYMMISAGMYPLSSTGLRNGTKNFILIIIVRNIKFFSKNILYF